MRHWIFAFIAGCLGFVIIGACKTKGPDSSAVLQTGNKGPLAQVSRQCGGQFDASRNAWLATSFARMQLDARQVKSLLERQRGRFRGEVSDLPDVRGLFAGFTKQGFRNIDGSRNNTGQNINRGKADTPLSRIARAEYGPGGVPRGNNASGKGSSLPSARVVSNYLHDGINYTLFHQKSRNPRNARHQGNDVRNPKGASDMLWLWGQFVDHDLTLAEPREGAESFPILVPPVWGRGLRGEELRDKMMPEGGVMPFSRTHTHNVGGVREQVNEQTHFLDGSNVYGFTDLRCKALRVMTIPSDAGSNPNLPTDVRSFNLASSGYYAPQGQLNMNTMFRDQNSDGLLPQNYPWVGMGSRATPGPNAAGPIRNWPAQQFFLAGDVRSNEHTGLTAMHNIFLLEHNKIARAVMRQNRQNRLGLSEDDVFQVARHIVVAEIQAITFREFLPLLLGNRAVNPKGTFNPQVDPRITNEFATAAYRMGHTFVSPTIGGGDRPLESLFFNPIFVRREGVTGIIGAIANGYARGGDPYFASSLRDMLFGAPVKRGSESAFKTAREGGQVKIVSGLDLAALNIQRGRDHGLASYANTRAALKLSPPNPGLLRSEIRAAVQNLALAHNYNLQNMDLFVGGLIENPVIFGKPNNGRSSLLGETFTAIIAKQFAALRDGDRYFYSNGNLFPQNWVNWINRQTLSRIIKRNMAARIGKDVFCAHPNTSQFDFEGRPMGVCNNGPDASNIRLGVERDFSQNAPAPQQNQAVQGGGQADPGGRPEFTHGQFQPDSRDDFWARVYTVDVLRMHSPPNLTRVATFNVSKTGGNGPKTITFSCDFNGICAESTCRGGSGHNCTPIRDGRSIIIRNPNLMTYNSGGRSTNLRRSR